MLARRYWPFILIVLAAPARSGAEPPATGRPAAGFLDVLSETLKDRLTVKVPVVRDPRARLLLFNLDWLEGDLAGQGHEGLAGRIRESWGVRRAEAGPQSAGAPVVGVATRYRSVDPAVHGDGRTILVPEQLVRARGRKTETADIQIQGVATGLRPDGIQKVDGEKLLLEGIEDTLIAGYLEKNGVAADRAIALFDRGVGDRGSLFVRGGRFERIAHLNQLRADPKALRELLDGINLSLSRELGRKKPLSYLGLYQQLVTRKASELAATYWARVTHGSPSYDNIGLFQMVDLGKASTVDRTHPGYSFGDSGPGFASEGPFVLGRMFVGELRELMLLAATSDERKKLEALPAERMARSAYYDRMAVGLLTHLGLDGDMTRAVFRHRRDDVRLLLATVLDVAHQAEHGAERPMGPGGETMVVDPARYDIFQCLTELVAVHTSGLPPERQASHLAVALRPVRGREQDDEESARRILEAAAPVIEQALAGTEGETRTARANLIVSEARRVNRPVTGMVRAHLRTVARQMLEELHRSKGPEKLAGQVREHVRANVRDGPGTPTRVAARLRHGSVELVDAGRRARLQTIREDRVLIEELSDGARDSLRVTLRPREGVSPEQWGSYRLELLHEGTPASIEDQVLYGPPVEVTTSAPSAVGEDGVVFEVPLESIPRKIRGGFVTQAALESPPGGDEDQVDWDVSFGDFEPVLASPLVDAELALWAKGRGIVRAKTPAGNVKAVAGLARATRAKPRLGPGIAVLKEPRPRVPVAKVAPATWRLMPPPLPGRPRTKGARR